MSTSGFHENLVQADVSQLSPPAFDADDLAVLKGNSPQQVTYANQMRMKKLTQWKPDLPKHVLAALHGIQDATWWLANKDKDSANIGWPESWVKAVERNRDAEANTGQPNLFEARNKMLNGKPATREDVENFEKFARKVCQSPELAYLTIMAQAYRLSGRNSAILAKLAEARANVGKHLDAIDAILGSPGD